MNFIKDQYYYVEEDNGESWLIKFCEFVTDYIKCYYLHVNGYSGYFSKPEIWGKLSFIDKSSIRLATSEEKNWLEECIKQGKYVDKNNIVKTMFKKDDYVVLLASCDGANCWSINIPINHCYQLARDSFEDCRGFTIYKDIHGRSNGWCTDSGYYSKLKFRLATKNEIDHYNKIGKPYNVTTLVKTMFKKGDYIVQLAINSSESFIYGYCYKQRVDHYYLLPCFDSNNRIDNGWTYIHFNKPETWRYATSEEIAEYNKLGKPYDVSVVSKSEYLKPEDLIEGNWYEGFSDYVWLFKFKKFDNKLIYTHKTVNTKSKFKDRETYFLNIENIKPANLEEVYKYFPQELLEEAKKRYPIGTEFLSACKDVESPAKCIVSDYKLDKVASNTVIWGGKIGFLFDDGNWAKVVSYPNKTRWYTNFPKEYFEVIEEVKVYVDSHIKYKDTVTNKDKLKLNIYIKPIEPIKVEPIVELKIKTVNKLTIK